MEEPYDDHCPAGAVRGTRRRSRPGQRDDLGQVDQEPLDSAEEAVTQRDPQAARATGSGRRSWSPRQSWRARRNRRSGSRRRSFGPFGAAGSFRPVGSFRPAGAVRSFGSVWPARTFGSVGAGRFVRSFGALRVRPGPRDFRVRRGQAAGRGRRVPRSFGPVGPSGPVGPAGTGLLPIYSNGGTARTSQHVVTGTFTMPNTNGPSTVTLTGSAAFTSTSSYFCTINDATTANAAKLVKTSGTAFTL